MADFRIDTTARAVGLSRVRKKRRKLRYISYLYHMLRYARLLPLEPGKYKKLPRLELIPDSCACNSKILRMYV